MQYAYDRGNLVRVLDALKTPAHYRYRSALLAQETDRNGLSFYFEYDGKDEHARCVHTWGDGGIYDHKLELRRASTASRPSRTRSGQKTQHQHEGGLVVRTRRCARRRHVDRVRRVRQQAEGDRPARPRHAVRATTNAAT